MFSYNEKAKKVSIVFKFGMLIMLFGILSYCYYAPTIDKELSSSNQYSENMISKSDLHK